MLREFKNYVKQFNFKDNKIKYKYYHSLHVMKLCKLIAKKLKLNKEDIKIAGEIGLLHDIGRFEQIKRYNTFNDAASVNHGLLSAKVLFKDNYIDKFKIKKGNYDIIKLAIINHNRNDIEEGLTERENTFCKIIRDADKIDIFTIAAIFIKLDNQVVNPELKKQFFNNQKTTFSLERNDADILVRTLSYIYDINFNFSFNYILKHKILKKFAKQIKSKNYQEYFDKVESYIKERVDLNAKS